MSDWDVRTWGPARFTVEVGAVVFAVVMSMLTDHFHWTNSHVYWWITGFVTGGVAVSALHTWRADRAASAEEQLPG